MTTAQIRQQLHNYIDNAREAKIKAIYTLLEGDMVDENQLTAEQITELDRRLSRHAEGAGRLYTVDETLENARRALKNSATGK